MPIAPESLRPRRRLSAHMTKSILAVFAPVLAAGVAGAPGCLIVDSEPPPDPFGDIAFTWSFDGVADCDEAGVDEVDLAIFQDGQLVDQIEGEPCVGGGLVLTEFLAGRYDVDVDAYSRDNELLYAGNFTVRVEGGVENDAGVVVLDRIGAEPPPDVGSVGLFWTFLYPATTAIESCAVAGVVDIDVLLTGPGGQEVTDTFNCAAAAGANFDDLDVGAWTLQINAFGRYHDQDIRLYADSLNIVVVADESTELGELALPRDESSFADVEAAWSFAASSCADAGLTELSVSVQRSGLDTAEAVRTVECSAASTLIPTFVPGSYTITVTGVGATADFLGAATADIAPDTATEVSVQLVPET